MFRNIVQKSLIEFNEKNLTQQKEGADHFKCNQLKQMDTEKVPINTHEQIPINTTTERIPKNVPIYTAEQILEEITEQIPIKANKNTSEENTLKIIYTGAYLKAKYRNTTYRGDERLKESYSFTPFYPNLKFLDHKSWMKSQFSQIESNLEICKTKIKEKGNKNYYWSEELNNKNNFLYHFQINLSDILYSLSRIQYLFPKDGIEIIDNKFVENLIYFLEFSGYIFYLLDKVINEFILEHIGKDKDELVENQIIHQCELLKTLEQSKAMIERIKEEFVDK